MSDKRFIICRDEKKTSGRADILDEKFEKGLDVYFDKKANIKAGYIEYVSCPNCSGKTGPCFKQKRFVYKRCSACGMVYATPRFKKEINERIHSQECYRQHYRYKVIPTIDYRRNVLARNKYNQLARFFKSPGSVLDIGCGLGEVLSVFKENGWDCDGIDFNEFAIDYASKKFGLNIIKQDAFSMPEKRKYDLVMLWGVLEHVYEPDALLKKCRSLLKARGLLLAEVPSADSFLVRYCEQTGRQAHRTFESARHIMLFSRRSLLEMFGRNGFYCRRLLSNGLDISTVAGMKGLKLAPDCVNITQGLLDESLQGDLLRGFFAKRPVNRK